MRGDASSGRSMACPAAIKDLFDFKPGWPTTFGGVRALKDNIAQWYCPFAERIEKAGAILVGKTNAPVMGFRGTCDNYLFGPTRNPFDTTLNAGGSSGGSAAAVADGLLPLAEGTDAGGSIRIPAAWCGVYGYKASYGRVRSSSGRTRLPATCPSSSRGRSPAPSRMRRSPSTRSPATTRAIRSASTRRSTSSPRRAGRSRGMRIGYSADFDVFPVDPRIAAVVEAAVRAFEEAGAHVEPVKLGIKRTQRELSDAWSRLMMPLNLGAFEPGEGRRPRSPPRPPRRLSAGISSTGSRSAQTMTMHRPRRATRRSAARSMTPSRASFATLRPARHADPRRHAGQEPRRRQHRRPERDQRRGGRPADRLVPDLSDQLHRPSRRSIPAGWSTTCRSACRSSAAATPTPMCLPRAQPSSSSGLGRDRYRACAQRDVRRRGRLAGGVDHPDGA